MSREGYSPIYRASAGSGGAGALRVDVQLFEGFASQASAIGGPYVPIDFDFATHAMGTPVPGIVQYDPNNWTNPSTHAYAGAGVFGPDTVAANSSIIVPQDGLYWSQFHCKLQLDSIGANIDLACHMGTNDDILSGQVGFNWQQGDSDSDTVADLVNAPRAMSGQHLIAFNEGDVVFWAFHDNSDCDATVNQFVWQFGYFGPLPAEPS